MEFRGPGPPSRKAEGQGKEGQAGLGEAGGCREVGGLRQPIVAKAQSQRKATEEIIL